MYFKDNVFITSTKSGFLHPISFKVTNTMISFKGFVADQDEIFVVYVSNVFRNNSITVDADSIYHVTTLAAGQTEIDFIKVVNIDNSYNRLTLS